MGKDEIRVETKGRKGKMRKELSTEDIKQKGNTAVEDKGSTGYIRGIKDCKKILREET